PAQGLARTAPCRHPAHPMGRVRRWTRDAVRMAFRVVAAPIGFVWRWAKKRLGLLRPIAILPYRGFGDRRRLIVIGRVLENRDVGSPHREDPWWRNAAAVIRRFRTAEVPDVGVRARLGDEVAEGR